MGIENFALEYNYRFFVVGATQAATLPTEVGPVLEGRQNSMV